jgi:hypothetical protein
MLARRLLILLAVLMALTALVSGVSTRQPDSPVAASPAAPSRDAEPREPVEAIVDAGAPEPPRVVVEEGEQLALEVRADAVDSVSLEGLDALEPVDPESPARFELLAELPGTYPIALVDAGREIGTLEIRAAR